MDPPLSLSLEEIRKYMLLNNCKVTNHALVKHFRKYLTNPDSQEEARKLFKSYVNILATMKNENKEKYLVLRKKYLHECPPEDIVNKTIDCPSPASPGNSSIASDNFASPFRQPPPYKPPPEVSPNVSGLPKVTSVLSSPTMQQHQTPVGYGVGVPKEMTSNYRDCVNEFAAAVRKIDPNRLPEMSTSPITSQDSTGPSNAVVIRQNIDVIMQEQPPILPPRKRSSIDQNSITLSRENSREENKENVDGKGNNNAANMQRSISNTNNDIDNKLAESENQISVKEATRKFNRMASEEEAKVVSPPSKKKPEKTVEEAPEVTLAHPKAKEWLVSAAKANYQELAKLLADYPELVRLQDPSTTGLHWAAKHGNEDVVKLIAGTYKANVNAKTGYTPLHLAMQFGRDNIFELLCNVYKANRDITDWSGNKPLDYRRQRTTVSASTYSKIKAKKKNIEKDSGFLRIGSLNVRVKKTTEAFSNFLGVGGSNGNTNQNSHHHHYHQQSQQHSGMMLPPQNHRAQMNRASIPAHLHRNNGNNKNEKIHKTWGSVDNIPKPYDKNAMPPPKNSLSKRSKTKRSTHSQQDGYNSMPSTPNQLTTDKKFLSHDQKIIFQDSDDSDTAAGFDSSWTKSKF